MTWLRAIRLQVAGEGNQNHMAEMKDFAWHQALEECGRRKKKPVNRNSWRACCDSKPHDQPCFQQSMLWMLPLLLKMFQTN
jgi:hypothetical protein